MKNNRTYRLIIHAELTVARPELIERLRRWPDIDLVHHLQAQNALLILAATFSAQEAYDLTTRLNCLDGIADVRAHYLFSNIQTLTLATYQPRTWLL